MVFIETYFVNVFTKLQNGGNPAAVCLLNQEHCLSDHEKQRIATELNQPATAFIEKQISSDSFEADRRFLISWFSPAAKLPMCGHGTVASAAVLLNFIPIPNTNMVIEFVYQDGSLLCRRNIDKITVTFPTFDTSSWNEELIVKEVVGDIPVAAVKYSAKPRNLLIILESNATRHILENLKPNFDNLLILHDGSLIRGIIVTARGPSDQSSGYDFYSRYFAPWIGINEDYATGSIHCTLGPYWSSILGKQQLHACQCSSRPGEFWLEVHKNDRLEISGDCSLARHIRPIVVADEASEEDK